MSLFGRRDELPNGAMALGPTPHQSPSIVPTPVARAVEDSEVVMAAEETSDEPEIVSEVASESVTTNTAPIPVQSTPLLYDERLHIKYMFTFNSWPVQILLWVVVAIIVIPTALSVFGQLQEEWTKLEAIPVLGILAKVIRIVIESLVNALWGVLSSLVISTGTVGVVIASIIAFFAVLVLVVLIIRPIYAWRVSRVQVGYDRVVLFRPGNKFLFLNDDTIRIEDTSIIRGVSEGVLAFDRWIFPGAAIITIDKDDLGGNGDNEPWEPVRKHEQLVKAVGMVIQYHKSQQNRA